MQDDDRGQLTNRRPLRQPWVLGALAVLAVALGAFAFAWLWQLSAQRTGSARVAPPTFTPAGRSVAALPAVATNTPAATRTPTPLPTATPTSTPTPTPTPIVVITGVQRLGRLETAQFHMQTIVDLENPPRNWADALVGQDKLLLVAEGDVVAGFDLQKVRPADIIVHGTTVTMTLPPPEILYSRVDNDRTYVYQRQTGVLRKPDPNLESEARRIAEERLRSWALERGVLAQASQFGKVYMEGFLRSLGLQEIHLQVRPPE